MLELNKVFLVGNLTRDPELKYLPAAASWAASEAAYERFCKMAIEMLEEGL